MENLAAEFEALSLKNPFTPTYMVVVNVIHSAISSCVFKQGDHLKENDIAKRFNVSRATVRRAFDVLLLDGSLIQHVPKGLEVAPMLRRRYLEIVELRTMLDTYSARYAAARRTEHDLNEMKLNIARLFEAKNADELISADTEFHYCIYRASGNGLFMRIYDEFGIDVIRSRNMTAPAITNMLERVAAEHMAIYEAILRQMPQAAFKASLQHTNLLYDPNLISCAFE